MSQLLIRCPKTGKMVPTGVETDVESLRAAWSETVNVVCASCGEVHVISVREAYLERALDDATDFQPTSKDN
jgi:hypothetical protein